MSLSHGRARRVSILFVVGLAIVVSLAPAGRAQALDDVRLYLLEQPVWHEPGDPLGLRLRITNDSSASLDGFGLLVRVFDRSITRSDLEQDFEVEPTRFEASSHSVEFRDAEIAAGASEVVDLDFPISDLTSLAAASESGIYPMTVTVTDAGGFTRLGDLTTQLIYVPNEIEVPLKIVPLWQLVDMPSRTARGYEWDDDLPSPVERAVQEQGWLRGVVEALGSKDGQKLRLGLAPLPRLLEEVKEVGDGYQRVVAGEAEEIPPAAPVPRAAAEVLEGLRGIAARGGLQIVPVPYSLPDLPSLPELEETTAQLNATEAVLEEVLGTSPGKGWVFPPSGRLDASSFEALRSSDAAASTFVSPDVVDEPGLEGEVSCQEAFLGITHTCPILLTTPAGRSRAYLLDDGLQTRFGALVGAPRDRLGLQRLFAETAMIWAELPGVESRVVALSVPPLWHPPPWISQLFVRALARAPWLDPVTPRQGLHLGIGAVARELVPEAPVPRNAPDEGFLETVQEAADVVESFARMKPPVPMVQRLRRDVLAAQSRLWWGDTAQLALGASFAQDARAEVEEELDKITIGGRQDITLTSRTGDIPLVLSNEAPYPVSLRVALETTDLDLQISQPTIERTFGSGTSPLPLEVTARSSGIFPVGVSVEAPDGFTVYETEIFIRSTEFNEMALAITLGALGFLVLFYIAQRIRRRRRTSSETDR